MVPFELIYQNKRIPKVDTIPFSCLLQKFTKHHVISSICKSSFFLRLRYTYRTSIVRKLYILPLMYKSICYISYCKSLFSSRFTLFSKSLQKSRTVYCEWHVLFLYMPRRLQRRNVRD